MVDGASGPVVGAPAGLGASFRPASRPARSAPDGPALGPARGRAPGAGRRPQSARSSPSGSPERGLPWARRPQNVLPARLLHVPGDAQADQRVDDVPLLVTVDE